MTPDEPIFRAARTQDLPSIIDLLADDMLGRARNPAYIDAASDYDLAFRQMVGNPDNTVIVATDAERIVGCYQITFIRGLSHRGALRAQVESVRIASSSRGAGIGSAMMRDAIERARDRGANILQLTTDVRRPQTRRFYERLGFIASHTGMKLAL